MNYLDLDKELDIIGDECFLFGKGRSVDTFNYDSDTFIKCKYRVAINHSVFFVPKCWAVFYYDYDLANLFLKRESELRDTIIFKKCTHKTYSFNNEVQWNPKDLLIRTQTSLIAVQVLHSLGFRTFNMVGFDSMNGDINRSKRIMDFMEDNDQELDRNKQHYQRDFVPEMFKLVQYYTDSLFIWHKIGGNT